MRLDETIDAIGSYSAQDWTDGLPVRHYGYRRLRPGRMCSLHDAVELAARGVPMVTLCMEPYMGAAAPARVYGLLDARLMAVQHPLAALAPKEVMQRADAVVERRIKQLMTAH